MTMHLERIAPTAWRTTPWGKHQGVTHEIRRWDDDLPGYRIRISVAEILADGPFTPLPGYRRWLAVLDPGAGLTLLGAGSPWHGARGASIVLDGATPIDARVATHARVFNLIARAAVPWTATWSTGDDRLTLPAGTTIVHAPGPSTALAIDASPRSLDADDTLVITTAEPTLLALHAPAVVVHLASISA